MVKKTSFFKDKAVTLPDPACQINTGIVFSWREEEIDDLLASCEADDVLSLIMKYFPRGSSLLEVGCGAGRWLKYLGERGWAVVGVELSRQTVIMVHHHWPELSLIVADASNLPLLEESFDGVLALGLVEHWAEGPEEPLREIFRVLKKGGVAIITQLD